MAASRTNSNVRRSDVLPVTTEPGAVPEETGARTLRRGLQLLDLVQAGGPAGVRVVDLCRAAGLERATVHRLLATLLASGYVAPLGRFRYLPGPRLGAAAAPGTPNMAVRLQPVLERVSAAFGDAAFAIVREGACSHCIARHVGAHPVQVLVIQIGTRQPLGVGAAGLALLSALSPEQIESVVAANAPQLSAYGGMTPERMRLLVRATRERGWSLIGNHATRNVLAVGMAVRDARGAPVAAISMASTLARMPRERQVLVARAMAQALREELPDGV